MSSIQLAAETMETLLATKQNPQKSPIFKRVIQIFHESCHRQKQLTDLHLWIRDLTQPYLQRIQNQQQQLIIDLAAEELHISADPMILERIVREFLHNVCKYTPASQTITIQTEANELEISLCVINTGVEIAEEEQELIFNQFYRIPNNDPWKYGGTGLGLTLVKKLAKMLEATVDVRSENEQTVFCIRFPKRPAESK